MAHPKRNSRRITVGERLYRWYYRFDEDDYNEPRRATVSVLAEDNLNGAAAYAHVRYAGAITPSMIRRVIEAALSDGWDPSSGKQDSKSLNWVQSYCCVFNFPRLFNHEDSEFICELEEKGGLHMKIRCTSHPKARQLITNCTLNLAECTEQLATAFIDAALEQGWQPERSYRDVFWLSPEHCDNVINDYRQSQMRDRKR